MQRKLFVILALITLLIAWFATTPTKAEEAPAKPKVEAAKDETQTTVAEATLSDKVAKLLEKQKTESSTKRIPKNVRDAAECIVVFPSVVKAGLLIAGKTGQGLVSCRHTQSKNWGAPSYVNISAASIGLQAGIQQASVILVLLSQEAVDELLNPEVKLGAGIEIAAGPVGGEASLENAPAVLSYVRTKGLFAGIDLEGAKIGVAKDRNAEVYGEKISAEEILFIKDTIPTRFDSFMSALGELAPIPAN